MSEATPQPTRGPIAWMAQHPVAANLLMLALIAGGSLAGLRVKQEVFPQFDLDQIAITVAYPGASPAEVEQGILLAVEEAVVNLDGVRDVRSFADEGLARVNVDLETGVNRDKALSDVKSAVDRIVSFPRFAEKPEVALVQNRVEAIWLVLHGDVEQGSLHRLGEQVRDRLLEQPEVSYVTLQGVKPLEIAAEIPQATLRRYGLTLEQVATRIRQHALEQPAGGIKTPGGEVLLRTAERRDRGRSFADIPIITSPEGATVYLGDLATVHDGYRESDFEATFEGNNVVWMRVYAVGNESPTAVAAATKEFVKQLEPTLPPGVAATTWLDRAQMFEERINLLLRNAAVGLLLVLVVLGLFLEPRLAFWVTMGIPISFLGSLILLPMVDVSLNMVSVFGFIVTLGMVVDDAIVVGENVFRLRREGFSAMAAAVEGARRVAVPVFFSIATTVAAFSPLIFIPGVRGKFMRVIPLVVILVLLLSLIESFFILPAHLGNPKPHRFWRYLEAKQARFSHGFERFIQMRYGPIIRIALRHRWLTLLASASIFFASLGLVHGGHVKFIDFPQEESDWVVARAKLASGVPVEETRAFTARLVQAAQKVIAANGGPGINRGMLSIVGEQGSHTADVYVILVPTDQRPISASAFAAQWREVLGDVPSLESLSLDSSTGDSSPAIDLELNHRDPAVLEAAARELAQALARYEGVTDVDDGIELGKAQYDFELSPRGKAAGLTAQDVASQVRGAFFGSEALRQQRGRDEVQVRVRLPRAERESLATLEGLTLRTPDGGEILLREAANIRRGRAYTTLRRTNGQRVLRVSAQVDEEGSNAQEILAQVREENLSALGARYPGLRTEGAGRQRDMQEFMAFLAVAFALALLGIYGLIAIPLGSYLQPLLVVMMAIPFGFVGALLGHFIQGTDWSLVSWVGLVALSGVVVNDSIVLVNEANRVRAAGLSPVAAATAAATQRFRPIVLTSLTTFGGLAPMILETSVQARVLIPMAVSLGYGIVFATLVTLVLVPTLFVTVEHLRGFRASEVPTPSPRPVESPTA